MLTSLFPNSSLSVPFTVTLFPITIVDILFTSIIELIFLTLNEVTLVE